MAEAKNKPRRKAKTMRATITLAEIDHETIAQKAAIVDRMEALALFSPKPNYIPRHADPVTDTDRYPNYVPKH